MADTAIRFGGPKRYLLHLRLLADYGVKIIILVNETILQDDIFVSTGVKHHTNISLEIITTQSKRPVGGWALCFYRSVARNRKRLARYSPQAIFIYGSCNLLAASALKRIYRVPLFFDPRDNPRTELQIMIAHEQLWRVRMRYRILQVKERYFEYVMSRIVNHYFFQTDFEAAEYRRRLRFAPRQYTVLPNSVRGVLDGVMTNTHERGAGMSSRTGKERVHTGTLRTILFCGALIPRKAALNLVQAIDILSQEGIAVRLRIAGSGSEEERIRRYVHMHRLEHVELLGWVSAPHTLLRTADLLVLPSLYDALPDVLLEAFAAGVATIGSDVAGIRIAIGDERFLFKAGSAVAIADKIRALYNDPQFLSAACEHAKTRYRQYDFDWAERFVAHAQGCVLCEKN